MKSATWLAGLRLTAFLTLLSLNGFADSTFVKFGTTWNYLDIGSAAPTGSGAADWRNIAFNDGTWSSGPAELGYGNNDERTTVSYGGDANNKYITTYFRHTVNISNLASYGGFRINLYVDDGAVVYINGTEVVRNNMPGSAISYGTLASSAAAEDGHRIITYDIATSAFVAGDNQIAVEVHQNSASSSDLTFDLELIGKPAGSGGSIISYGSVWKYLDNGTNQGTAWQGTGFNDASWSSGPAQLGYGDGDEATTVSYGPSSSNKYVTTYFRKSITLNPSNYSSFSANIKRDDGCVVYVNGTEVYRSNLSGTVNYNTYASNAGDDGNTPQSFTLSPSDFTNGTNVIAVEMHQTNASSSDLSFDFELTGAGSGSEPEILRGPFLNMLSGSAITIKWQTATPSDSRVLWGTDVNNLNSSISDGSLVTDHELRITGLTEDTKYYYAIATSTSILRASYRNYFVTAPPANTTRKIRIGVFGDAGTGNATQKATRDGYLLLQKGGTNNADLALMLGDNAYNNGFDNQHQTNFFDIYDDNVFDNHPVFSVPGNHEYDNNGTLASSHAISYYDIFTLPTAAESGGTASGTEHYYSFDYGNIHFIMLDSYGYDGGKHLYDSTGPQAVWLKADLAAYAHQRKWTIVCLHHPPYTNGTHYSDSEGDLIAIRQQITPILERFGVDLVLAGHSHVYERSFLVQGHTGNSSSFNSSPSPAGNMVSNSSAKYDGSANSCPYFTIDSLDKHGTVYVVAGSAGQVGGGTRAQYPVFYYRNYSGTSGGESGALYLEIEDNRIDAKFVGASGTVRDQFTIMKDVNRKTQVNTIINTSTNINASWVGAYNWYTDPTAPVSVIGTGKTYNFTPGAIGNYTYYVSDSLGSATTCITDTVLVQVNASLAVTLLNYDAILKNDAALLRWSTAFEQNSDNFTIERSTNGRDFSFLMIIPSKGNSSTKTEYEYIDYYPKEGNNYYRLVQTDKDGKSTILGVRVVTYRSNKPFSVSIKPNPVTNRQVNASVNSRTAQSLLVRVFDMNGAEVYKRQMQATAGENILHFPLNRGSYVLSVSASDGTQIKERLIVK